MAGEALREIHYALVQSGFERVASYSQDLYRKDIKVGRFLFPVRITIVDSHFVEKPVVQLESMPEGLSLNVPHLSCGRVLCYLDDAGVEFDPYSPRGNLEIVISALYQLLEQYAKKPELLQEEFRRELPAYWGHEYIAQAYLVSTSSDESVFQLFQRNDSCGKLLYELVVASDSDEATYWRSRRNSAGDVNKSGKAILIKLPDDISFSFDEWPPSGYLGIVTWLDSCGAQRSAQRFIDKTFSAILSANLCFVIFQIQAMFFGVMLDYTSQPSRKVMREVATRKGAGRKRRKKRLSMPVKRKLSLISRMEKYEGGKGFSRCVVFDAKPSTIYSRNLTNKVSLSGMRIALIGCGTVGGYAANLLYQAGAGSCNGQMLLFDDDILDTENLGRHYLGAQYLGEKKAVALAKDIQGLSGSNVDVLGCGYKIRPNEVDELIRKFDLVVDATGEIAFSSSLCHYMHRASNSIPVVYGWVDGGGLAARALLDETDLSRACYNCLKDRSITGEVKERFQLFKKGVEIPVWQSRPCGIGGFLPFSSQASVTVAGLIQSLCLGLANKSPSPRFRHLALDKRIFDTKSKDINPLSHCPCCQI
ncbi:MAG: ThiF family adenylyltransferase [Candidatus Reddybacter sp.]